MLPVEVHQKSALDSLSDHNKRIVLRISRGIRRDLEGIKVKVYDIGKRLSLAKRTVGHGNFQRRIEETFGDELPYSTAAAFKDIYDHFKDKQKLVKCLPVSLLLLMKQKEFSEHLIGMIEADPESFKQNVNVEELKKHYHAYKKGELTLDDFLTLAMVKASVRLLSLEEFERQLAGIRSDVKMGLKYIKQGVEDLRIFSSRISEQYLPTGTFRPRLIDLLSKEIDTRIDELQDIRSRINGRRPKKRGPNL